MSAVSDCPDRLGTRASGSRQVTGQSEGQRRSQLVVAPSALVTSIALPRRPSHVPPHKLHYGVWLQTGHLGTDHVQMTAALVQLHSRVGPDPGVTAEARVALTVHLAAANLAVQRLGRQAETITEVI